MEPIPIRIALVAATIATMVANSLPLNAQQTPPPRDTTAKLPTVQVRATIAPLAAPSVGGAIPAQMSTITGRDITAWHPRVLPDALSAQPGISFYDDLGTPWKLNLSMRGFTAGPTVGLPPGITLFLDGVRQNEADAQEVNFDLLPTEDVERVEILSGSASLLGPNSLGGSINLITARGSGPASGSVETTLGSYGAYSVRARASGSTSNGWNYYASGDGGTEHGWRQATGERDYHGFINTGREGTFSGVRVQALVARSRAETAGSLPESIYDIAPQANFTPGDLEDLNSQQLTLSGYRPALRGNADATLYVRRSAADRFNVNQAPDPNVRGFTENYTLGGTIEWRWSGDVGRGHAALRVGIDGTANRARVRIFNEAQTSASSSSDDDSHSALTTDVQSPNWNVAGYTIGDYRIGAATLSAGVRADRIQIPFRNDVTTTDNTTSSYTHVSPRGGVSVDVGRGASLFATLGDAFRAPAILELGCADPTATCPLPFALGDDPPLRPVRARTYEAGTQWLRGSTLLRASVYRTDVRNEIFFIASEGALLSGHFSNIDRTRREGLDLAAQGSILLGGLDWYANYALTRATFESAAQIFSIRSDDDFVNSPFAGANIVRAGARLPLVPDQQLKVGGTVRLARTLHLGVDGRVIGQQWLRGDEANETKPLSAYTVTNARLAWSPREWTISGMVTNVFESKRAIFGTFNENRQVGELERFLTPLNARGVVITFERSLGRDVSGGDQ